MIKVFDFKEQLSIGEKGAAIFHSWYPELIKTDGYKGDFKHPVSGEVIELKCDSYYGSPNFFMERFSSITEKSPGGPWQSLEHGVTWFVYFFVAENLLYWFKASELVKWLDKNSSTYPVRLIRNKGWTAQGYLVPRVSLEHLKVIFHE